MTSKATVAFSLTFSTNVGCLLPEDRQVVSVIRWKASDHGDGDVSPLLRLLCLCLAHLIHRAFAQDTLCLNNEVITVLFVEVILWGTFRCV